MEAVQELLQVEKIEVLIPVIDRKRRNAADATPFIRRPRAGHARLDFRKVHEVDRSVAVKITKSKTTTPVREVG